MENPVSTEFLSQVWTHLTDIQPVKGEGIYLYGASGEKYIDFTSGIGVVNTGHCHPKIVTAIQEQAEKLLFGQMNCVIPPSSALLAKKLKGLGSGLPISAIGSSKEVMTRWIPGTHGGTYGGGSDCNG